MADGNIPAFGYRVIEHTVTKEQANETG